MIEIKDLNKKFGKFEALKNVTINCLAGESIALIGPNGCGKTTLIKSILNMVVPDSGSIIFNGNPIKNNHLYREKIGYMPQIGRYPENMSIGQVLETIQSLRKTNSPPDHDLYEEYHLSQLLHKRMGTLSGGTRQKVSAVIAFLFKPDVFILDEPTSGLDPIASEILKEKILIEKQKGKLILITSHLLSELDEIITETIFMQEGIIRFHKKTDEIKEISKQQNLGKAIALLLREGMA